MYTLARKVGKLVEIRVASPVTVDETIAFSRELQALVAKMDRFISCSDFSRVVIFPPEVVATYVECMKILNTKLERTALLTPYSATVGLQLGRLLRDAGNPKRRTFRSTTQLALWLSEVLTIQEQVRLQEFLSGAA